jgi:hypothetical protein
MLRFYFHMRNTAQLSEDDVGQDLLDLDEAKAVALISAREILADGIKHNSAATLLEVIIADKAGKQLATISAKDIVPGPLR